MSAAERWEAAVRSALLGTGRDPSSASPPAGSASAGSGSAESGAAEGGGDALERALAGLEERGSEARLLGGAAVLALYRRAGALPGRDPRPLPEPAPEETARRASPAAARVLARALSGEGAAVIPEWLEMAAAREMIVPEEHLPALLDALADRAELQDALLPVLGSRGRWLAARNPAWRWADAAPTTEAVADGAPEDARGAWETETADGRRTLLRRARKADPALGLELVRSTWDADPPKDRAAFLAELREGLSDADEPFLEAALDDRRKEVRLAAADLLRRLPTSRLARRMVERARPLLRISLPSGGLVSRLTGAKPEIAVELPEACTKDMVRDGVEAKAPQGTGERAWWLQQVIAATAPSTWSADAPPETWIEAAARSEWTRLLLNAFADAAERHRDAEWAEALIRARKTGWSLGPLAAVLPPERWRALGMELLSGDRAPLAGGHHSLNYVAAAPHPLGAELTRAFFARIPPAELVTDYGLREQLRVIAPRADPAVALEIVSGWEAKPRGAWIDLLHIRHALHEAFAS